ncbi:hypothetical protein [Bacillus haynesii]|uniref:hypothetical protein n=1 Tax=Bacillus haynesii TaxID=1925021 RepID=UPI00228004F8|nr:hypothetical protein [Bacillus haynesii]MCY9156240.1 hypothetical protein [Bacillus haynesii]MCY9452943.1 hypothetical protein [Bacillus haynesii]
MEGKVLTKEELGNMASEMGFSLIEIEMEKAENKIELLSQQDFLDFHKHVGNKLLFFYYEYEDKSYFTFPNEIPDEYKYRYPEPIRARMQKKIDEYKKIIDETDFSTPSGLMLFYIKDGFLFYNYSFNEDREGLPDYDCLDYNKIAENVRQMFSVAELEEMDKNHQKEINKQIENLKEIIFTDPKFKLATNLSLRKDYSIRFFENKTAYQELLRYSGYNYPIKFIEKIWSEFKAEGLHKK